MGESVDRDVNNFVVELTKEGPDGKIYAIVREGHDYFIKVSENKENLVAEDFNYIGGLKNKTSECHPSYAKAIKKLNLRFISLNEALGKDDPINVFEDDNLVEENVAFGAASMGFVQEDEELTEDETAIDEMLDPVGQEDADIDNDGDVDSSDDYLANRRLKISKAIEEDVMDEAIEEALAPKKTRAEKAVDLIETLSDSEKLELIESLKKKA